jgi:hypothetical protein
MTLKLGIWLGINLQQYTPTRYPQNEKTIASIHATVVSQHNHLVNKVLDQ